MSIRTYAATTSTHLSPPPPPPPLNPPKPINPSLSLSNSKPSKSHLTLRQNNNKPTTTDPTVTWTSSISRYCRDGRLAAAATEFIRMRVAGVEPNHITFMCLLSACADFPLTGLCFGMAVHGYVRKLGLDTKNVKVGTAIVDLYSKCGCVDLARLSFDEICEKNKVSGNTMIDGYMRNGRIEDAIEVFDEMPERDTVSWTALVGGFVKRGQFELALEWFQEMQLSGVEPDYVTMVSVLSACANLGALGLGLWVHRLALNQGIKDNVRINNSLIDMYSRCGCIQFARQVFEKMKIRTVVSWNSIIVGFSINGYAEEALEFFNLMQKDGFEPDGVSFTGALAACSHAGLVEEGLKLFDVMMVHRISPRIEHYGCIVDLYSRAGRLEDALDVIENMPMRPNEVVFGSLLAACRTRGDVQLAERLMNYLLEFDPNSDSNYVLLSNIYAAVGSWHGANRVRRQMKDFGIQKRAGISSIEIDCSVHEFVAGDKSHVETEHIYAMLDHLCLELSTSGYVPESNVIDSGDYD
ncbi:pentatricopeptide repeat-containing protein At1g05750, chloroplastic [Actinidia eriantha]|uniref:pentatricopeptide repeat-containing protein At1g05750, chloroplastic n=1 Tax=Actinidia eriantha TaxID=165200 RepID=UPI00258BB7E2|nr:pentatricopeptide repeat-containing protein At1g05750, chloroplastic [Actinidia eriantha]